MKKILTQQPAVRWSSVFLVLLPWFAYEVHTQVSRSAMVFTLSKFTSNPALIGFISSFNFAGGLLIGSLVSVVSDRIWTPYGRRGPFLIAGFFTAALVSLLLPHIQIFWLLALMILIYQISFDVSSPLEPLTMEIIPAHQRGRAGAIRQWIQVGSSVTLYYFIIAQFDKQYSLPLGLHISGETLTYIFNAVCLLGAGSIILFLVHEVQPANAEIYRIRDLPVRRMIKEMLTRPILPLLGLSYVMMNIWVGLDQFEALLITQQWGYSKAEFGQIMSYGMLITVFVVPLGGWISDRFNRLTILKFGLAGILGLKGIFYVYAEYIAPDSIPPFMAVITMGLIRGGVVSFVAVAAIPLIFDYVSTNRLGALSCGMGITFSLVSLIQSNSMGIWITFSSKWLYDLPEGRFNYMAAYHYIFIMGILGLAYLYLFEYWDRIGFVRRKTDRADGPAAEKG